MSCYPHSLKLRLSDDLVRDVIRQDNYTRGLSQTTVRNLALDLNEARAILSERERLWRVLSLVVEVRPAPTDPESMTVILSNGITGAGNSLLAAISEAARRLPL